MEENKYHQLCVWEGTPVTGDDIPMFEAFFKRMGYRVKFDCCVETLPDLDRNGNPVKDTGGRSDAFFYIHDDDIVRFSTGRFQIDIIRWWEDVLGNGHGCRYTKEFLNAHPNGWIEDDEDQTEEENEDE